MIGYLIAGLIGAVLGCFLCIVAARRAAPKIAAVTTTYVIRNVLKALREDQRNGVSFNESLTVAEESLQEVAKEAGVQ